LKKEKDIKKRDELENENLRHFLIRKGSVNKELWASILVQSKGSIKEKINVSRLIFDNYTSLPIEADDILKKYVDPTEHKDLRKGIALELTKSIKNIPAGLYHDLLFALIKDPDPEIRKLVDSQYTQYIVEPISAIAESFKDIQLEPISAIAESFKDIQLDSIRQSIELAGNYQLNILSSLNGVITGFAEALSKSIGPAIETFSKIQKIFQEPQFQRFDYNWMVFLPFDIMLDLYHLHLEGKDQEIKQLLTELSKDPEYHTKLIEKIEHSMIFKKRIPILKDIIDAYQKRKYSMCIPVLLAQIEGIIWDYAESHNIRFKDKIVINGKEITLISSKTLLKHTKIKQKIDNYVTDHYLKKIYTENFRHGILHGRDVSYDTEENAVKLLLFIRSILETCN